MKTAKKKSPLIALRARSSKVPQRPGIYRWLDDGGNVLYIGKAKNLRNRIRNYVPEKKDKMLGPWKIALLERVADFDYTVTANELEALILETNLIKEHRPKYNVLMKDDKNYVYVRITMEDPYPSVSIVRQMEEDHAKYFGPYLSARDTRHALELLDEVFAYLACKRSIASLNKDEDALLKPCIEYQIGRCNGLCTGKISKEEYRKRMEEVVRFFRGDRSHVVQKLTERMQEAATLRKFERAGKYRDTLLYVKTLEEQQIVSGTSGANTDAIGIALLKGKTQVVLLQERDGKVINERSIVLSGSAEGERDVLTQFIPQYYSDIADVPDTLLCSEEPLDRTLLEEWFKQHTGKRVEIIVPERGKKSKLLTMAEENAEEKVAQQLAKWEAEAEKLTQALAELEQSLKLPRPPKRIECYDISHLGGTETVGSMVVFIDGKAKNDHYRSFTIRTMEKGSIDDYKALREILMRRLRHLTNTEERLKERGLSFGKMRKGEKQVVAERLELTLDPRDTIIVAREKDAIIGIGQLVERPGGVRLLKSVWVDDPHRGRKLGHLIIRKLIRDAKKGKIYVTIHPALEEYYAQLGFRHIENPPPAIIEEQKEGETIVMMCEVSKSKGDASLGTEPDLLVLDGGKGQLGIGLEVLQAMHLKIPIISLAKREEEVFAPLRPSPLPIPIEARFLLQRARDEAHRFANRHREKRLKNALLPK